MKLFIRKSLNSLFVDSIFWWDTWKTCNMIIIITGHSIHAGGYSNRVLFLICGYSCFNAVTLKFEIHSKSFLWPILVFIHRQHILHTLIISSVQPIGHFCLVYEMCEVFAGICHLSQYSILNGIVCCLV